MVSKVAIVAKKSKMAKKLKANSVSGYSNDSNPFGDCNLNVRFVWRKKIERDLSRGIPVNTFSVKAQKQGQRERMAEIEKLKKRREERAREKEQHEKEMAILARERARAEFQDWEKKEEEFLFEQSKIRSCIRLREGRMKPIDILSKYLDVSDYIEIQEPYMVFKGMTVKEMEELHHDIKMHLGMDRQIQTHIDYWEALLVVCDWELAEARKKDALDCARVRGEQPPAELFAEERGVGPTDTDVKNLLEGKTCNELVELHFLIESQMSLGMAKHVEFWEVVLQWLPVYKAKAHLREIHTERSKHHIAKPPLPSMGAVEEEGFGSCAEVNILDSPIYCQSLKPRYFTRVHTGYVWNKYNQIHYDHDNPPPKMVQGYKFNIFYPDLVDKTRAPIYTIEKDGNSDDETCIIRFSAGAPYEDVAFRIVNKEWDRSHKKGFKSTFEHGILHLHFNFKRYRYRR